MDIFVLFTDVLSMCTEKGDETRLLQGKYTHICYSGDNLVLQNKVLLDTYAVQESKMVLSNRIMIKQKLNMFSNVTYLSYKKQYYISHYCNVAKRLYIGSFVFDVPSDPYISYILQQDEFTYLITNINIIVLSPDMHIFGAIPIDESMKCPVLKGMQIHYISDISKIATFNILTKKKNIIYSHTSPIEYFTLHVNGSYWIACDNDVIEIDTAFNIQSTYTFSKKVKAFVHRNVDTDYQCPISKIKESFVETFMYDDMDRNEQNIIKTLCFTASSIYSNPSLIDKISQLQTFQRWPFAREMYKCVFINKDIYDIIKPPSNMFDKHTNYQDLTKDMGGILHRSTKTHSDIQNIEKLMESHGIFINPQYILSGMLHYIWPLYGKGWHHNIESVPKETCDVVYFVATDKNFFGGSFFFYRHPLTHTIQAVPDINGTMKFFKLSSSKESPLWHAIGSFTAHRLSYGLSKKADMGGSEL